jgi:hypothetical protein
MAVMDIVDLNKIICLNVKENGSNLQLDQASLKKGPSAAFVQEMIVIIQIMTQLLIKHK